MPIYICKSVNIQTEVYRVAYNFSLSGISSLSSLFGEYSSIRSGTYGKLLKAYYAKVENAETTTRDSIANVLNTSQSSEAKALGKVRVNADSLSISASNLLAKGNKSVFSKEQVEKVNEETGEKTTSLEYNKEEIEKAVNQFISDYNAVLDKSADIDSTKVMGKTIDMIDQTEAYKTSLEKIGISIGEDNKLTLDSEKFQAADMESVEKLFNDSYSFGQQTMQKALQISSQATKEALTANLYTGSGSYDEYNYSSFLNMYL